MISAEMIARLMDTNAPALVDVAGGKTLSTHELFRDVAHVAYGLAALSFHSKKRVILFLPILSRSDSWIRGFYLSKVK